MTLYERLGVTATATPDEIKKGYHAMAMKNHPDHGGDSETFAEINRAYMVLADPERRAKYDATGDAEEREPDNSLAELVQTVMSALDEAMQRNPPDIVAAARQIMTVSIAGGKEANRQVEATKKKLEKARKRLRFKGDGENLIDRALAHRIADAESSIAGNIQIMERFKRARDFLDLYEMEPEIFADFGEGWG